MSDFVQDVVFTDQPAGGITAKKLNISWRDNTISSDFVGTKPAIGGVTGTDYLLVLRGDNTYAKVPATAIGGGGGTGTGDMLKAVYDTNNNGKVDTCDSLSWTSVTGKPTTFPPDSTAMLKSVYDTNSDNIVDHAALADSATNASAVPWTGVTGKPSTFPPDATAELVAHKGQVNGYASLDASGKVPVAQLPPFGTGDMTKSVYDTNGNNIVDAAESVPWSGVTGKPSTFPPDSTAMLKSIYDTNSDNIVDHAALADAAPWTGISGRPSTFPPDSTAMLKSVYDTNSDGICDHAALADSAPWTGITGKPSSFTPSAHALTHLDNGTDAVPIVTTSRTGLCPTLTGNTAQFLRGDGTFASVPGGTVVDPGTWTSLSLATGWTAPSQAQYRIQTIGSVITVFFRGFVQAAYSALGTLIATLPAGAQPSIQRMCCLGGAQNTGTPSDCAAYIMTIASSGNMVAYFLSGGPFVWADPSQTQIIYLDGLNFSL